MGLAIGAILIIGSLWTYPFQHSMVLAKGTTSKTLQSQFECPRGYFRWFTIEMKKTLPGNLNSVGHLTFKVDSKPLLVAPFGLRRRNRAESKSITTKEFDLHFGDDADSLPSTSPKFEDNTACTVCLTFDRLTGEEYTLRLHWVTYILGL